MDPILIILIILTILAVINIWLLFMNRNTSEHGEKMNAIARQLELMDSSGERLRSDVDEKLENIHRAGQNQFREAREIITEITLKSDRLIDNVSKKLGDLDKTNQKIVDFSGQLKNLQDILKNPKQRGVLGEYILEHVLANALPPDSFSMQYKFSDGEIVDAAVFVKDKIVPIDSKFSLENYERVLESGSREEKEYYQKIFKQDLKTRIDETAKYIRPDEGTTEFAFMFIPSEAIYYDLLVNTVGAVNVNTTNMIEYAFRDKHVVIVSPTSFLAYLQTVLQGLKALEIEDNAKQIRKRITELSKHWNSFDLFMGKLGKTMTTSVNQYNQAYKEFGKIDRDVMRITGREEKIIAPESISKPEIDIK